jgi:transcriptional regulator with XRE-family HTH domain
MPPRIGNQRQKHRRNFIRAWREERGLSQDQLVDRVREQLDSFSKASLSRLENGKQPYSEPILEALAYALMIEPGDLVMRDPKSEVWSIMDTLKGLGEEDRAQVARIIATFRRTG